MKPKKITKKVANCFNLKQWLYTKLYFTFQNFDKESADRTIPGVQYCLPCGLPTTGPPLELITLNINIISYHL